MEARRGSRRANDAAVVGLPAPDGGGDVVAAVVPSQVTAFDESPLRMLCRERLTATVPRRLFVLEELPLSMIGKVCRRQVRDQLLACAAQEGPA